MKRLLLFLFLIGATATFGLAQSQLVRGSITAADSVCRPASCVLYVLPVTGNTGTVAVQITGTYVATLQFEETIDGTTFVAASGIRSNSTASDSSTSSTGIWQFPAAGVLGLAVRASAYTSGTATVVMQTSSMTARTRWAGSAGTGDVVGPASAVDGNLAVFDGTSGKVIKDGGTVPTISAPSGEVLTGTGSGVGSSPNFTYTDAAGLNLATGTGHGVFAGLAPTPCLNDGTGGFEGYTLLSLYPCSSSNYLAVFAAAPDNSTPIYGWFEDQVTDISVPQAPMLQLAGSWGPHRSWGSLNAPIGIQGGPRDDAYIHNALLFGVEDDNGHIVPGRWGMSWAELGSGNADGFPDQLIGIGVNVDRIPIAVLDIVNPPTTNMASTTTGINLPVLSIEGRTDQVANLITAKLTGGSDLFTVGASGVTVINASGSAMPIASIGQFNFAMSTAMLTFESWHTDGALFVYDNAANSGDSFAPIHFSSTPGTDFRIGKSSVGSASFFELEDDSNNKLIQVVGATGAISFNSGGMATKIVCWGSDGKTLGYATMLAGDISACTTP